MTAKKKRTLGKGLNELLASSFNQREEEQEVAVAQAEEVMAVTQASPKARPNDLQWIAIEKIHRSPYQPRRDIDPEALEELAESIKAQGVLQPIIVRPKDDEFELIAGERRWRASQQAGLDKMPAVVKNFDDETTLAVALIENIQRENLNPMEEARALQRLIDEFELTHMSAAKAVGKSRATVTNLLRLMSLNEDVRVLLEHGDIEMGHARCLLSLETDQQTEAARTIVTKTLSVREAEQMVKRLKENPASRASSSYRPALDPDIRNLQEQLSGKLSAAVEIKHKQSGKGAVVIRYNNIDELDGILNHIH